MGMLFNSETTLEILETLNAKYKKLVKHGNKGDKDKITTGHQNGDKLYKISSSINIDLKVPSTQVHPNRWEQYLTSIENYLYALSPALTFREAILNALYNFLDDDNCLAIEFYAIEGQTFDLKISQKPSNGTYYAYICIQSVALSQTTAHLRAVADIPSNGSRKRVDSPSVRAPAARRRTPKE